MFNCFQAAKVGARIQRAWPRLLPGYIITAIVLCGICLIPDLTAQIPAFDGGVVSTNSGSGGPQLTTPSAYADKMRGVALAFMLMFIVVAALLVAAGKQGLFLSVVTGAIFLFGAGWIVISIAKALQML